MSSEIKYALDSDVFMQAARAFYAFDIAPGFWDALIQHAEAGIICSIDRVKEEIKRGKDELTTWACSDFVSHFQLTDQADTIAAYGDVMKWAYAQPQYMDAAKSEFAEEQNADAWLVSHALAYERMGKGKLVIVTQETFDPNIRRKIKIPNACKAFGMEPIDLFRLLRILGVRLK